MKKRLLAWLLAAALTIGLIPATVVSAMAAEMTDVYTLSDDYISVSVSKKNGGFTIRTVEGDRLKKSDNDKDLLYHDGQYDTSFLSFRVGEGANAKDYIQTTPRVRILRSLLPSTRTAPTPSPPRMPPATRA